MFIIKNAIINLGRNKGRNILLGCILFAIITTTVVTLSITSTTDAIIADYEARFKSQVFIEPDMELFMENMRNQIGQMNSQTTTTNMGQMQRIGGGMRPSLEADFVLDMIKSPYLASYEIHATNAQVNSYQIKALDYDNQMFREILEQSGMFKFTEEGILMEIGENGEYFISTRMSMFRILGNSWETFETGERLLIDGDFPTEYGQVLISEELAILNNLGIGDAFTIVQAVVAKDETQKNIEREFVVTGLYMNLAESADMPFMQAMSMPLLNPSNEILSTFDTAVFPKGTYQSTVTIDGTFYLTDPTHLDNFENYVRNLGLGDEFIVRTDVASYQAIVGPVLGLRNVASTFMWVVLSLGGVILILLASIAIRERKYEIGVLRAMGLKKKQISAGLWTEMFILTSFCLVVGLGVGTVLAQPVSDSLLAVQLENTTVVANEGQNLFGGFGGGAMMHIFGDNPTEATPIEQLDISLNIKTVIDISIIAIILSSVASIISTSKITKYEPIKILMERN